jgi:hypothetical protein
MNFDLKQFTEKSSPTLKVVFIVSLLFVSLGRVARWDLLDQVAMADNFLANGVLYAEQGSDLIHGHSVYFPGVAYFAVALKTIGIDYYLVEVMLLIAVIVLLLFLHVLSRYANSMSNEKYSPEFFYPLLIAFFTMVLPMYGLYALEFKPDTLSLLMGYIGLSLIWTDKNSFGKYVLGIFLICIALVFKQQYLAFQVGLFFAAFFVKKKEFRLAVLLATIISIAVFLFLFTDENIRFWSIEVLSDDGISALNEIIFTSYLLVMPILLFLILLILMKSDNHTFLIKVPKLSLEFLKSLTVNPWYVVTLFVIGGSVLSTLKAGGNSGNAQIALVVIFPLAGLISYHLVKWKIILIAWFGVFYFMGQIPGHLIQYKEAIELKSQVKKLQFEDNYRVLTGSDVYYASRYLVNKGVVLENYWANALIENISAGESLNMELRSNKFDYLILENRNSNNLEFISKSKDYDILFFNGLGIIAKSRN